MFHLPIILVYYHLLIPTTTTSASSLLYTLDDVRYSLSDRIVTIPKLGAIRGLSIGYEHAYYDKYHLVNVEAFLGIQYGLYHGRFEPSKERFDLHSSTQVKKHIEFGPACSQFIWKNQSDLSRVRTSSFARDYYPRLLRFLAVQNEDQCLYMNIYQPQMKDLQERLPVVLFVHGDGYDMGTGGAFDGAVFASYAKAIVVTINYRLGPLGFLYVSNEHRGNYALQDIYTALHWLKNYVSNFHGDPDRITLYGTDSGAVLASLVVLLETVNGGTSVKKRRKSLVHRLILNDRTFLSPYATSTMQEILSQQSAILAHLPCSASHCLRNQSIVSTDDLLRLRTYSLDGRFVNAIRPLEDPFPFDHAPAIKESTFNPLRSKFFQHTDRILPENLRVLLTMSSSMSRFTAPAAFDLKGLQRNYIIDYLINYAYSIWNSHSNQYEFDQSSFGYHQQILAPLLDYAKYIATERTIHVLERSARKYESELPYTFGYVLAPSMSVYNHTYAEADDRDRAESVHMMNLFANLIHNGDVNKQSPYCRRKQCETLQKWHSVFPQMNFILLKDGNLSQSRGYYAQVHYLFNNLISSLLHQQLNLDLLHTWKTLYQVSANQSTSHLDLSFFTQRFDAEMKNPKYVFILTLSVLVVVLLNFFVCIVVTRRGHGCRKREYHCLDAHTQLTVDKLPEEQQCDSSSSSTNSNGTINQQLIVHTNYTTPTTNSSLSSTPPVDLVHVRHVGRRTGIVRSALRQTSEAVV